ncbi:MFS transporter [Cellulomonas marina]|uniref:Drug resistance transporter, EmrB/QacA subfamily n=1 Tax=Cellulomonas marina TaxID=988821 RepID=A0A1I0X6I2_9CELL|nr:MFS transporter [Cellulomonas marina]GIG28979.1 MFS transporter [Cellulomonas marina]SFA96454.1 drug resistance transporter, EmrB/QacA subfamily [Cellulomonas marina]
MSTSSSTPADAPASARPQRDHRWLTLVVIGIAQTMVVLDATIVNIALPSAQADLGFGDDQRQWMVTAYSLAFGSLLLLGGRLSDLFGRRRTFLVGLIGFAVASALGGAAGSFELLVAARALQGVFGALLAPSALSLLTTTFTDPRERGKAFGVFGALSGSGGAIGLLLGGVLTEYTSWRWCLLVNLVIAGIAVVGALVYVPATAPTHRPAIDWTGVVTATAGLFLVVFGFAHAETDGWGDPLTWVYLAAGAVLLAVFVVVQRRVAHPLLPLRVVLDRDRGGAFLAIALVGIGMFGIFLFLTYYLQQTLGYSSLRTGFAFLAMPVSISLGAALVGARLLPRVGPKVQIFVGGLVAATGLLLLQRLELDSTYLGTILPALAVIGFGMGLVFSAAMATATSGVDRQDAGVASATVNTMQQVGGSIGTALLSSLYAGAVTRALPAGQPSPADVASATLSGYHTAFAVSAVALVGVALAGGLVIRRRPRGAAAGSAAGVAGRDDEVPTVAH